MVATFERILKSSKTCHAEVRGHFKVPARLKTPKEGGKDNKVHWKGPVRSRTQRHPRSLRGEMVNDHGAGSSVRSSSAGPLGSWAPGANHTQGRGVLRRCRVNRTLKIEEGYIYSPEGSSQMYELRLSHKITIIPRTSPARRKDRSLTGRICWPSRVPNLQQR